VQRNGADVPTCDPIAPAIIAVHESKSKPMTTFHAGVELVFLAVLTSGCVATGPMISLQPVGPAPAAIMSSRIPQGNLVVYSALEGFRSGFDDVQPRRSEYKILSADGMLLKRVANTGTNNDAPEIVLLSPGSYTVIATTNDHRDVSVPIVIATDQTTFVHLDGSELVGGDRSPASAIVRLPDGAVVGWRVTDAEVAK